MAAPVSSAPILRVLDPAKFRARLSCDRTLLPSDGVDVPIVLDLDGCHAKPRVLASCTSGQELIFSEPIVNMVHVMASSSRASELRLRFVDREIARLPGRSANVSTEHVAASVVTNLVRIVGTRAVLEAVAAACKATP
jgi:hypothetical protein